VVVGGRETRIEGSKKTGVRRNQAFIWGGKNLLTLGTLKDLASEESGGTVQDLRAVVQKSSKNVITDKLCREGNTTLTRA